MRINHTWTFTVNGRTSRVKGSEAWACDRARTIARAKGTPVAAIADRGPWLLTNTRGLIVASGLRDMNKYVAADKAVA